MKYAIVYTTQTGNTAILANAIKDARGNEECVYIGEPCEQAFDAEELYIGFWTDKGNCSTSISDFLKQLHHKQIFLFGTAGFGGEQSYFERILENVKKYIAKDNTILGSYMCQGKMPMALRQRYENMLPEKIEMQAMIDNFDKALKHPSPSDLQELIDKIAIPVI